MSEHEDEFDEDERRRNTHGEPRLFVSHAHRLFTPLLAAYGPPLAALPLTAEGGSDLFGTAIPIADAPPPNQLYPVPEFRGICTDRAPVPFMNGALTARHEPPAAEEVPSRPTLLPGVTMPAPVLTMGDVPVVKPGSYHC